MTAKTACISRCIKSFSFIKSNFVLLRLYVLFLYVEKPNQFYLWLNVSDKILIFYLVVFKFIKLYTNMKIKVSLQFLFFQPHQLNMFIFFVQFALM